MTKVNAIINCLLNGFRGTIDNTVWHSRLKGCYYHIIMSFSAFARARLMQHRRKTFSIRYDNLVGRYPNHVMAEGSLKSHLLVWPQGWGHLALAPWRGPEVIRYDVDHPEGPWDPFGGASKIAEPRGTVVEKPVTTCSLQCIERWWLRARVHCGIFRQG